MVAVKDFPRKPRGWAGYSLEVAYTRNFSDDGEARPPYHVGTIELLAPSEEVAVGRAEALGREFGVRVTRVSIKGVEQ